MEDPKVKKRNLWFYPLGTVGRDMIYNLFTNFILLFILYTRGLTDAQLGAVTGIMIAARVFDALNDPIMGNIIERTRTRWGKFKPWLAIGMISTAVVVYLAFNTSLEGWSFVIFFGIIYFMYSITYTMNDISYWGMIPALSTDGDSRNQFTSRATLFAGVGSTLASILIPLLTTGAYALGGNARTAYGRIALIICVFAPICMLFTIIGVRERRETKEDPVPPVSFKKIWSTITGNDQLLWMTIIFLCQQIASSMVYGGVGSSYIYFKYGYEGGLYSTFTTVGVVATAFLMLFYPAISRKIHRKPLLKLLVYISLVGFAMQLLAGFVLPATTGSFWITTIGFMLGNFGLYGFYLIMMISIINTVEYNELKLGTRDEAIITSMRPFLTKLASAIIVALTYLTYIIFNVTEFTNKISDLESAAEKGLVSSEEKGAEIANVIAGVSSFQTAGLLLSMTILPLTFMLLSYFLYKKNYKLDEEEYDRICAELAAKKH